MNDTKQQNTPQTPTHKALTQQHDHFPAVGGGGGGKGTKSPACGCGSGAEQSSPTHPRWHWHRAKPALAPPSGCTQSPWAPQPTALPSPRHSWSSHAAPFHPASHRHSPCSHQPLGPHSRGQRRCWHHSPCQPSSHAHAPLAPSHAPCGALHACMHRRGSRHTEPPRPSSHSQRPSTHLPRPAHGASPAPAEAHVRCSQSAPVQPGSHAQRPLVSSHVPRPLQPLAHATGPTSQLAPV